MKGEGSIYTGEGYKEKGMINLKPPSWSSTWKREEKKKSEGLDT